MKNNLRTRIISALVMSTVVMTAAPASAITSPTYEKQVLDRVNVKRVDRDRVPLKYQTCVDRYAERQAAWMASHRVLRHQKLGPVLDACNLRGVAENIAYGYTSGNAVVSAWMRSTGHRANLINSRMRYSGVGAAQDKNGVWWVAQVYGRK
ncbi:CAP domain-containing protein [Aeromicrobium sp.]|uniref:CAP domain-containing protein n=1 Tax=Aeromicrobium sp. TaxID=1871063 RepID=UPI0030C3665F